MYFPFECVCEYSALGQSVTVFVHQGAASTQKLGRIKLLFFGRKMKEIWLNICHQIHIFYIADNT